MKHVEIYTVNYCPYCTRAKEILNEKGIPFKEIDISDNENEYREKLAEFYKIEQKVTVPQIIIGGERIGGLDNLEALIAEGKLDDILNQE